ncbi:MAG: hypothetical protein KTR31_31155 [Myxococcales bacterium]|nr:hypothetical protein [Myxococcales bacterium]
MWRVLTLWGVVALLGCNGDTPVLDDPPMETTEPTSCEVEARFNESTFDEHCFASDDE